MTDDKPHTFTVTEGGLYEINYGYRGLDGTQYGYTELVKLDSPDDPAGELVDLKLHGEWPT